MKKSIMKKIISILIVLMMGLSLLTACGPTTHKLDFWVNDTIETTYELEEGATVVVPIAPSVPDYEFEYWLLDGTSTQYQPGDTITIGNSDIKIVAIYVPIPKYSVSFYDGNTLISQITGLISGATATAPNAPVKTNMTFVGWRLENTDTIYIEGQFVPVSNANIKLIAEYQVDVATYTLSFYVDGVVVNSDVYQDGYILSMPTAPNKSGFVFSGWQLIGGEQTIYQAGDNLTVDKDMIFAGYYVEDTSDDIRVIFRVDGVRYEVAYYES